MLSLVWMDWCLSWGRRRASQSSRNRILSCVSFVIRTILSALVVQRFVHLSPRHWRQQEKRRRSRRWRGDAKKSIDPKSKIYNRLNVCGRRVQEFCRIRDLK